MLKECNHPKVRVQEGVRKDSQDKKESAKEPLQRERKKKKRKMQSNRTRRPGN